MGRMIGGLNPAAQELHVLRGKIAEAESERRGPSPVLTPRPGSKGGYGLKFDIEYQGRRGKLGTDNFGRWYVIIGEGSEANVVASDFKAKSEAAKAFARLSGATREGATRHHATKRSRSQAALVDDVASAYEFVDRLKHGHRTKKSPAQLQREIDEALAKPRAVRAHSTKKVAGFARPAGRQPGYQIVSVPILKGPRGIGPGGLDAPRERNESVVFSTRAEAEAYLPSVKRFAADFGREAVIREVW